MIKTFVIDIDNIAGPIENLTTTVEEYDSECYSPNEDIDWLQESIDDEDLYDLYNLSLDQARTRIKAEKGINVDIKHLGRVVYQKSGTNSIERIKEYVICEV